MRLSEYYPIIKEILVLSGYENEIKWVSEIPKTFDKTFFYKEYTWVVINSGMSNKVATKIFQRFWNDDSPNFEAIRHPHKNKSLKEVHSKLDHYFNSFLDSEDKLEYIKSLPHIGDITKYHLARNLGLNYAKPDRHLVRIAGFFGYSNVQEFCEKLSLLTLDPIGVVDLVLWRFATLYPDYLEILEKKVEKKEL